MQARYEELTLDTTLGWRLDDAGAAALAPLESGDQVRSLNGQPVATYDEFRTTRAGLPTAIV